MRITVLDFDTGDDTSAALAAISAALTPRTNGKLPPDDSRLVTSGIGRFAEIKPAPRRELEPVEESESLPPSLFEAWQHLVAMDDPDGVTSGQMAGQLHIKSPAATWRLSQLVDRGLAHRIRPGRYRAGERGSERLLRP